MSADTYTASDTRFEGLEAVRKRPAMSSATRRLRPASSGLRGRGQLVDEALAGYCDSITGDLHSDGSVSGRRQRSRLPGHTQESGKPAAEVVLTVMHAGGKFEHSAYKVSGGLHGVGISVVNALSEWLESRSVAAATCGRSATRRAGVPTGSLTQG